jgi:hypothetical protein
MRTTDHRHELIALIGPVIDRIVISVNHAVTKEDLATVRDGQQFSPSALALIAANLATGRITLDDFAALNRYQTFGPFEPFLAGLEERGAITRDADRAIVPTPAGLKMARAIVDVQFGAVARLWAPRSAGVQRAAPLVRRAAAAAEQEGLPLARYAASAWRATSHPAADLWCDATTLRLHRAEAHAAAWTEAGHTAASIKTLAHGQERDAIEFRTNQFAALPWADLSDDELLVVLGELGALPGNGYAL